MMNKWTRVQNLLAATWLFLGTPAFALTNSSPHIYPGSVRAALQLENDLYDSLDARYRDKLQTRPEGMAAPDASVAPKSEEYKTFCEACVSADFVNLINHIAHAKAIDKTEPGYFNQYMGALAHETENGKLPVPPDITQDRYWTDDIMNDQAGCFNQMIGMCMAINLSHHYLGHVNKYAAGTPPGKSILVNNLLTRAEWEKGVKAATLNSLTCALGIEGSTALFGAIGRMPLRPAWTACIVPQSINIKGLNKQLAKYEVAFFRGGLNPGPERESSIGVALKAPPMRVHH
jgi:hypothetical protein